jgi:SM-20-related protein
MTPDRTDALIERLASRSFAVEPDFLPGDLCADLQREAIALADDPNAIEAGVGRGEHHVKDEQIRRARIRWMDGATPAQVRLLAQADTLRVAINRRLFLGLFEFEAQLALTPVGGFYARHVDGFEGARNRVVSLVAYLDAGWRDSDGGALRVWPPEPRTADTPETIDIRPERGTLVLMLSESVPHEVLPSNRARASLAGWFRIRQ